MCVWFKEVKNREMKENKTKLSITIENCTT